MSSKPAGYVVVYDNDDLTCPMGWDPACEGALCVMNFSDGMAVFDDRSAAKQAIRVSVAFAKLQQALGKPANDDFLLNVAKQIRIVPLRSKPG